MKGSGLGRDHHPHVFTTWLAGAGVKPGTSFGESDEFGGYQVAANPVTVYDFHATILHLLGALQLTDCVRVESPSPARLTVWG